MRILILDKWRTCKHTVGSVLKAGANGSVNTTLRDFSCMKFERRSFECVNVSTRRAITQQRFNFLLKSLVIFQRMICRMTDVSSTFDASDVMSKRRKLKFVTYFNVRID